MRIKCPECGGRGEFIEHVVGSAVLKSDCWHCNGEGTITLRNYLSTLFWKNVPVWFVEWYAERRLGD